MKSGHILRPAERNRMIPIQDMFIDVGARTRADAEQMGIRPGLPIAYATEFRELNGTGRYLAKAWDDRVGLAVITEALREVKDSGHPPDENKSDSGLVENAEHSLRVEVATSHRKRP